MIKLFASSTSRLVALILVAASLFQLYYFLMISSSCVRVTHHTRPASKQQIATFEASPVSEGQKPFRTILFWTKYFRKNHYDFGTGWTPFMKAQCPNSGQFTCLTTHDRGFFNQSDAILFHGHNLDPKDLPPPGWRRPHQHFIFVIYESPVNTPLELLGKHFNNYFNRTMTYRRDSDIVNLYLYGQIKCIKTSSNCQDFPRNRSNSLQESYLQKKSYLPVKIDLSQKKRTVAWFVSHCATNSSREFLVNTLSRYIPVDIYGKCSNISCTTGEACNHMLRRNYRFYLSFENSMCPDYVTEKLYRPLAHDTVPVVFGGANYSEYLPVGAYIDARDFSSPLHLANHLKKLMVDDELYLSYFRWREKYFVEVTPLEGWCKLCQLAGDKNVKSKIYSDIEAWWAGTRTNDKKCFSSPVSLVSNTSSNKKEWNLSAK